MKPAIRAVVLSFSLMFLAGVEVVTPSAQAIQSTRPIDSEAIQRAYGKLPVVFIQNKGQVDSKVAYYAKGPDSGVYFGKEGIVFDLMAKNRRLAIRQKFVGANSNPAIVAGAPQPGKVNIFQGNDSTKWTTGIPTYGTIAYKEIYPGIDLVYRGETGQLKYEFVVKPGSDYKKVQLAYAGIDGLVLSDTGNMILKTALGEAHDIRPVSYQEIGGKRVEVESRFRVTGSKTYGFEVSRYDPNLPLIIDPSIVYSSFLGGGSQETGNKITVDASGNAYILGQTDSSNFPTQNPFQANLGGTTPSVGQFDVFISKLSADGSGLVYSTFLGGGAQDRPGAIALDSLGNICITGTTFSSNFPTMNPIQAVRKGSSDMFITKLTADGSALVYSTYLGSNGFDDGTGIVVDGLDDTYVAGGTNFSDFPTVNPFQGAFGGSNDAVVVKLDPEGSALIYSTYLGGAGSDAASDIAMDDIGNTYITGGTSSSNFPTANAIQASLLGSGDSFVTKLNADGSALVYSTYLGGTGGDTGRAIAVDGSDNAYILSETLSTDFPTINAAQATLGGGRDAAVTKLSADGAALIYSTYLGGSAPEFAFDLVVDDFDKAYAVGTTQSEDFPTAKAIQPLLAGSSDGFVTKISLDGSEFDFSTFMGAVFSDRFDGIALDAAGDTYLVGQSTSSGFPTTTGAYDRTLGGPSDAVVVKLMTANQAPVANAGPDSSLVEGRLATLDGTASTDADGETLSFQWTQTAGPAVTLSSSTLAMPTFTTPEVSGTTILTFQLVVNDGNMNSAPDLVNVTVLNNMAPTANAGADQFPSERTTATLIGSGSTDPEGDPLTYSWTQTAGPAVTLSSNTAVNPTFTAPEVTGSTLLTFQLVVNDGRSDSAPDAVDISIQNVNRVPVPDAGTDQTAAEGALVTLNGSATDPDGDTVTFLWTQVLGPTVTLSDPFIASPSFTAPAGMADLLLAFQLTVDDGSDTAVDTVNVSGSNVVSEGSPIPASTGGVLFDDALTGAKVVASAGVLSADTAITIQVLDAPEAGEAPVGFGDASFAVEFGPSGTVFNAPGVTVTIPLASSLPPGTQVDLFKFNPETLEFEDTGIDGIVDPDGLTATAAGLLSFSKYALFKKLVATPQEIIDQINDFVSSGDIAGHGTAQSLIASIQNAERKIEEGKINPAKNMLEAFIHKVNAKTGPKEKISAAAAAKLTEMATSLLNSL